MARLLADEDFRREIVEVLRSLGHDVVTLQEVGYGNQRLPDTDVLAFALAEERVVLTHNRKDYKRLHKSGVIHAGIIAAPQDNDISGAGHRIHHAIELREAFINQLVLVDRPWR
jgi:uncharacterized protein with PIN domain